MLFEALAKSDYLVTAWRQADAHLEKFESDGRESELFLGAEVLCGAIRRLRNNDPGYWSALALLPNLAKREKVQAVDLIRNGLDKFLMIEFDILTKCADVDDEAARRLLATVRTSLADFDAIPTAEKIEEIRKNLKPLEEEICRFAGREPKRGKLTSLARKIPKPVLRASSLVAGAACVTANGMAALHTFGATLLLEVPGVGVGSISGGLFAVYKAVKG